MDATILSQYPNLLPSSDRMCDYGISRSRGESGWLVSHETAVKHKWRSFEIVASALAPQGVYEGFGIFAGATQRPDDQWEGAAYAVKGEVRIDVQILAPTKTRALQEVIREVKAEIRASIVI